MSKSRKEGPGSLSTTVHIYPLSRLVHASPSTWLTQLEAIEKGKVPAYSYYGPLREAVVFYCKSRGRKRDEALSQLRTRASSMPAPRGTNPLKDNTAGFGMFVDAFHPRIDRFQKSFLAASAEGSAFTDVKLIGAPHFMATDSKGKERYVYLHASKWTDDDLKAYLELLAIIIADRYAAPPESLWCMDLRTGTDVKWKSAQRMRTRCENTAKLYARFLTSMSTP